MEEALEKESVDQQYIRNQARKSVWYLFLVMAGCIGLGQLFFSEVPGLFYLGAVLLYGVFLYETYMSRKTNEELWRKWEERWRERRTIFQLRASFSESLHVLVPAILSVDTSLFMSGAFVLIAFVTGFRNGSKKWRAKEYYYEEYVQKGSKAA